MRSVKEEEDAAAIEKMLSEKSKANEQGKEMGNGTAAVTEANSSKTPRLIEDTGGQLNLGTISNGASQKFSSKFSKANTNTTTNTTSSTVPKKVRKKYLRDGEDLTRALSPSRSRPQSPTK